MWVDQDLHWASEKGYLEIVKILLESGGNINIYGQVSAFVYRDYHLYYSNNVYILVQDYMYVVYIYLKQYTCYYHVPNSTS